MNAARLRPHVTPQNLSHFDSILTSHSSIATFLTSRELYPITIQSPAHTPTPSSSLITKPLRLASGDTTMSAESSGSPAAAPPLGPSPSRGESIEERCLLASLITLESHFTGRPVLGPKSTCQAITMLSKSLGKTQDEDVRWVSPSFSPSSHHFAAPPCAWSNTAPGRENSAPT